MICGFRWQIVIHGGIDGYTRIPVYLKCSDNNRAQTALECFESAVHEYGLPSRVRSDKGGENTSVSLFMLQHPLGGPGRGSMITGRSVHNRIRTAGNRIPMQLYILGLLHYRGFQNVAIRDLYEPASMVRIVMYNFYSVVTQAVFLFFRKFLFSKNI